MDSSLYDTVIEDILAKNDEKCFLNFIEIYSSEYQECLYIQRKLEIVQMFHLFLQRYSISYFFPSVYKVLGIFLLGTLKDHFTVQDITLKSFSFLLDVHNILYDEYATIFNEYTFGNKSRLLYKITTVNSLNDHVKLFYYNIINFFLKNTINNHQNNPLLHENLSKFIHYFEAITNDETHPCFVFISLKMIKKYLVHVIKCKIEIPSKKFEILFQNISTYFPLEEYNIPKSLFYVGINRLKKSINHVLSLFCYFQQEKLFQLCLDFINSDYDHYRIDSLKLLHKIFDEIEFGKLGNFKFLFDFQKVYLGVLAPLLKINDSLLYLKLLNNQLEIEARKNLLLRLIFYDQDQEKLFLAPNLLNVCIDTISDDKIKLPSFSRSFITTYISMGYNSYLYQIASPKIMTLIEFIVFDFEKLEDKIDVINNIFNLLIYCFANDRKKNYCNFIANIDNLIQTVLNFVQKNQTDMEFHTLKSLVSKAAK